MALVWLIRATSAADVELLYTRVSEADVELTLLRLQLQQRGAEYEALREGMQRHRAEDAARQAEQVRSL